MFRALRPLTILLLTVCATGAAPLACATHFTRAQHIGPTYKYTLKKSTNSGVCEHMLSLFNDQFTRLWSAPPQAPVTNDPVYSTDGKYSFPRLPSVEYSADAVFQTRFFSQPTSPEFSAIHWEEGMAFPGGCPAGSVCSGEQPFPVLIAHFDFDNDGIVDTVIKEGYFPGYPGSLWEVEYLTVWRGQNISINGVADLWKLEHPQDVTLTPIIYVGMYLRPFIYENQAYVAQYVQDQDEPVDPNAEHGPRPKTWQPHQEDMLVQQYSFTGQEEKTTGRPQWTARTICDLEMQRLSEK